MNAAANAQVRKWKTAVLGDGDGGERPGVGVVAAGHAGDRAAFRGLRHGACRRSSRARRPSCSARSSTARPFEGAAQGPTRRSAGEGDGPGPGDHQGHEGTGVQAEHRPDQPGGAAQQHLLPGGRSCKTASRCCTTSAARELRIDVPLPPKPNATSEAGPGRGQAAGRRTTAAGEATDAAGAAAPGTGRAGKDGHSGQGAGSEEVILPRNEAEMRYPNAVHRKWTAATCWRSWC